MAFEKSIDWSLEPNVQRLSEAWETIPRDPHGAKEALEDLVGAGSPMSPFYLAKAHLSGVFGSPDAATAEQWYRIAADRGVVLAYYELGRLYMWAKRFDEAKEAFGAAAARNFLPAMLELGIIYWHGVGGEKNLAWAERLFRRAADHGSDVAGMNLGRVLLEQRRSVGDIARGAWLTARKAVALAVQSGSDEGRRHIVETSGRSLDLTGSERRRGTRLRRREHLT